jgi:uncharacterized protein
MAVVLVVVTAAWFFQRRLIYLPDSQPVPPAEHHVEGARDVTFRTSDGLDLAGWHVQPSSADREITVLVANGNAGNRASRAPLARALADEGFSVLVFDYRGYGGNGGTPSEDGLALDVRAAREHLVHGLGVPPERLIYFGESLGAAVVSDLATEHPPAGLLLRSPFVDLAAVAQVHYPFLPVRALLRDRFPVSENVSRIEVPTTVVYGTADSIVPAEQSRRVADAVDGPVEAVVIEGADHNDRAMSDGPELLDAVVTLAERAIGPS